jgi:hypothetical protein
MILSGAPHAGLKSSPLSTSPPDIQFLIWLFSRGQDKISVDSNHNVNMDKLFGVTWEVDPGISRFSADWKPDRETRSYEALDNGYKLTVSGSHLGRPYSWGYTAYYDGKKYPVSGRPDVDSIEIYRINDRITVGFFSKDNIPGGPYSRFVSEDGKTLEVQSVGHRADGSVFFDVLHYANPSL